MSKPRRVSQVEDTPKTFERTALSELRQGRQGKHHHLMNRIASEMESLPEGEAIRIPLHETDVSLANLRAAVTRAMLTRGTRISTFCDGKNLFVWKKTAATARYERKSRTIKGKSRPAR